MTMREREIQKERERGASKLEERTNEHQSHVENIHANLKLRD